MVETRSKWFVHVEIRHVDFVVPDVDRMKGNDLEGKT